MLGSAVQNIIAVSDSVFLYHKSELDFQAISIVSIFYLIVSAIGFGFSRGGQILIAKQHGANNIVGIKKHFYTLLIFEFILASIIFLSIRFFGEEMLSLFINDQVLLDKGMEYLMPRSLGIFFSYLGVGIVAYYTGVSKPKFIVVDTLFLAVINIIFNYIFIFGKYGFEEMGIAGAGLASALAEFCAFVLFILYMIVERNPVVKNIFKRPELDLKLFKEIFNISINIVLQVIVGLGSWLIFFGIIENLGRHELGISNIIRVIYLLLSVPTWGFASAMNTISSNLIGKRAFDEIMPATKKVMILNVALTMLISVPVLVFPEQLLYPFFGKEDMTLIQDAQPIFYILIAIMFLFSFGSVYFDSLIGMGKTGWGFILKLITSVFYLMMLYVVVEYSTYGLKMAWATEIFYWILITGVSLYYFFTVDWKTELINESVTS
ncbi:MATE family efflux transporter [Saprospiraceae bacterium]|nr:MATE family efflux transporter [Saprospiraceae bacterium]